VKRRSAVLLSAARLAAATAGLAALVSSGACGPSFQAIYEGNSRFEHCYALEENAQALVQEKTDCWRDWSEHYTFGQTRDRIHYATARYVALSQSSNLPTDEAMMMAAPGMTPRQTTITAPAPSNAFAPPPKVLDDYGDAAAVVRPTPRLSEVPVVVVLGSGVDAGAKDAGTDAAVNKGPPPAAACSDGCMHAYRDCRKACDKTYRSCMQECFK
jgi:hypothetical protein